MDSHQTLVTVMILVLAAAFLFLWMRRDRGAEPNDDLADALHEPLDGQP